MLCYVMLCYVMLCYVMLCYVMLCHVMSCYDMLCYVMLCYVMLCYVMLCYAMLCYVMLCYVMLCSVMLLWVHTCTYKFYKYTCYKGKDSIVKTSFGTAPNLPSLLRTLRAAPADSARQLAWTGECIWYGSQSIGP